MRISINSDLARLLDVVKDVLDEGQTLYIVGGAVRDLLLGHSLHDLDFVMPVNPIRTAKRAAKKLGVGFFVLDDERHTSRVVYHQPEDTLFPLDFVQFTGGSLLEDLSKRDFTINAMAVSIHDLKTLIDPLGGEEDLEAGLLKACSATALLDDPVRVLRAVRLALQFDLDYAPGLDDLIKAAAQHLPETSPERQRDEFFRILSGPDATLGMRQCFDFKIFDVLIPELSKQSAAPVSPPHTQTLLDHTFSVVEHYASLLAVIGERAPDYVTSPWWLLQAVEVLEPFADRITDYFNEELTPTRKKTCLVLLGALLHDIGKPAVCENDEDGHLGFSGHARVGAEIAWETTRRLQMSNLEGTWIQTLVLHHPSLLPMMNAEGLPERREIYRFYHQAGDAGIAIVLLSLAATLATSERELEQERWMKNLWVARRLLEAWWEEYDSVISPELFLDGNDLQDQFGISPGKAIGNMLAALREAQASGFVESEKEARAFVEHEMKKN